MHRSESGPKKWSLPADRSPRKSEYAVYNCAALVLYLTGQTRVEMIRLNRVLYVALGFSLVHDRIPIFADEVEAWWNGPVIVSLQKLTKDPWVTSALLGDMTTLDRQATKLISKVYKVYGTKHLQEIDQICQSTGAWLEARQHARSMGSYIIRKDSMRQHFLEAIQRYGKD